MLDRDLGFKGYCVFLVGMVLRGNRLRLSEVAKRSKISVQFTEDQFALIRAISLATDMSVASVVRGLVDAALRDKENG